MNHHDRADATPADLLAGAVWITTGASVPPPGQRPGYEFRTFVDLASNVRLAQLTITAHGVYEAFVNGVRVGDEELAPGLSSYHHTLYVQRHEVSTMLTAGRNELRVVVSDGWFRGRCGPARVPDNFGTEIGLLARLDVATDDGPVSVVTDTGWEVGVGAVTAADLMDGQRVDLRRTEDIDWEPVVAGTDPHTNDRGRLVFSPAPPVRRVAEHRAVSIRRVGAARQVVDFGVTVNGWVRLSALGPAGTTVTLTHGEWAGANGDLDTAHLAYTAYREPKPLPTGQVDQVVSRGRDGDVFEPRHTTHGFRYVAVDGLPHDLDPADVVAVEVRSDLTATGAFTCSDPRIARLHEITVAAWRANSCDVPTDCPTRERRGYTGDYQVFVRAAAFLDDVEGFSRKWLRALADDQRADGCVTNVAPNCGIPAGSPVSFDGSAGWGDAATIVPWEVYQAYGDPAVLAECYPMMRRWVDYAAEAAATGRHPSRIDTRAEPAAHEQFLWDSGFHWGEWLEPGVGFDFYADKGIIATAYLHRSALITGRTAGILGYRADADRYLALADQVKDAWQREFLLPDGHLTVPTQANHVRALAFDLVPEPQRPAVADALVELIRKADVHLATGFLSTGLLLPVLADTGHLDVAYALLLQDSEPSWLTMVDRGATAIWESWNGIDADGLPHDSLTHYARGAIVTFLHEHVAGLRAEPGRRRFRIAPRPGGGLTAAGCTLATRGGLVRTDWTLEDGTLTVRAELPDGAEAVVELPDGARYPAGPGRHTFTAITW